MIKLVKVEAPRGFKLNGKNFVPGKTYSLNLREIFNLLCQGGGVRLTEVNKNHTQSVPLNKDNYSKVNIVTSAEAAEAEKKAAEEAAKKAAEEEAAKAKAEEEARIAAEAAEAEKKAAEEAAKKAAEEEAAKKAAEEEAELQKMIEEEEAAKKAAEEEAEDDAVEESQDQKKGKKNKK